MNLFKHLRSLKLSKSKSDNIQAEFDKRNRIIDKIYRDVSSMSMDVAISAKLNLYDVHSYVAARLLSSHLPCKLGHHHLTDFGQLYPHLAATHRDTIHYVTGFITEANVVQEVNAGIRLCLLRHLESDKDIHDIVSGVITEIIRGNLKRRTQPCFIN